MPRKYYAPHQSSSMHLYRLACEMPLRGLSSLPDGMVQAFLAEAPACIADQVRKRFSI